MDFPYLPIHLHTPSIKMTANYEHPFPHFRMLTDNSIAALFLETVEANPDDAWAFVSRHYSGNLDLEALRDLIGRQQRAFVVNAPYEAESNNRRTRSVLVIDPERKVKRLLHLHMVKEPDKYGQWKIYGVEQE